MTMAASLSEANAHAPLPVEQWDPAHCGAMDLVIRWDGAWIHEGTPIGRPALIRLFSRVLRLDADGYVLVTPAEKLSITVEDVPFLVVACDPQSDQTIRLRTNVGDEVTLGASHPLEWRAQADGQVLPYAHIRGELFARFNRNCYYTLIDLAQETEEGHLVISSGGHQFPLDHLQ